MLDDLIARARAADVDRTAASRYVRELERWARPVAPPPRRWPWLLVPVLASAVVLMLWRARAAEDELPVRIGDRVAIVAAPDTQYRVVRAERDETMIAVDRGTVTARLWPGARRHHLRLVGGGVTATATGTIYQLTVGQGSPIVRVLEGAVEVRDTNGVHVVPAAASWPRAAGAVDAPTGRALRAMVAPAQAPRIASAPADAATPTRAEDAAPANPGNAAPANAADDAVSAPAGSAAPAPAPNDAASPAPTPSSANRNRPTSPDAVVAKPPAAAPVSEGPATLKDRWHTARLLRSQGKFAPALDACLAIADERDATWSPIALVEAARIALGPLADPDRAITLSERVLAEWPSNTLASEARELRCRARTQLGRDCGAP